MSDFLMGEVDSNRWAEGWLAAYPELDMARLIIALCIGLTLFAIVNDSIALRTARSHAYQAAVVNNEILAAQSANLPYLVSACPAILPAPIDVVAWPGLTLLMIMQC